MTSLTEGVVTREPLAYLEAEARRFAGFYPEGSDGRNTFVIFADKIAAMHSARKVDVEKVARAIEDHFVKRFGATIESDGPSHLVRCLRQTAFNPENLAKATIEAMGIDTIEEG